MVQLGYVADGPPWSSKLASSWPLISNYVSSLFFHYPTLNPLRIHTNSLCVWHANTIRKSPPTNTPENLSRQENTGNLTKLLSQVFQLYLMHVQTSKLTDMMMWLVLLLGSTKTRLYIDRRLRVICSLYQQQKLEFIPYRSTQYASLANRIHIKPKSPPLRLNTIIILGNQLLLGIIIYAMQIICTSSTYAVTLHISSKMNYERKLSGD